MDISFDWQHEWKRVGPESHEKPQVIHRLNAYLDGYNADEDDARLEGFEGSEVGYMKVAYVPEELWAETYNGAVGFLRWTSDWKGWCYSDVRSINNGIKILSQKIESWHGWLSAEEIKEMPFEEKVDVFERYLSEARKRLAGDYEESVRYNVGKPEPHFVFVARSQQCQGIGTAIYEKTAETLAERYGKPLFSSTLRSDEAEAVWRKLDNKHGVDVIDLSEKGGRDLKRFKLDLR